MPFNRESFYLGNQYQAVKTNKILRESYNNDLVRVANLMRNDEVLCNEIFGQLGQKVKQGVQAGAQAVQAKLIQPIINLIMSKLPEDVKQQVTQAAQGGPQALQQYLQQNGDPNVANQLAAQQQPAQQPAQAQAAESINRELGNMYVLLSLLTSDASVLTEAKMSDRAKFTNFQRTLNQIASEITDPAIKQQAQNLATYIQQNYSQRGKAKNKGTAQTPPSNTDAGQIVNQPPQQQSTPDYTQKPNPAEPPPQQQPPQQQQQPPQQQPPQQQPPQQQNQNSGFMSKLASFGQGASSLLGKVGSFIKENPNLSTAGALGLMLAITAATGGVSAIVPFVLAAGKSAAVGAATTGAVKGGSALLQGKGFKQAGQEALSGAKTGARFGAVGGAAGNLVSNIMKNVSKPPGQEDSAADNTSKNAKEFYNHDVIDQPKLNSAIKAIQGKDNLGNVITYRDSEWSKKLEDAVTSTTQTDDPDEYIKFIANSAQQGNEEAKSQLANLLRQAGPMPKADFDQLSNAYKFDDNQKLAFSQLFKVRSR